DEKKKQAFDPWAYSWVGASAVNGQYERRVEEIREYFVSKGLNKEFCDVGVAEMALQPTNIELLQVVLQQLNEQKRGTETLALLDVATSRTLAKNKIPEGHTKRSFETTL